MSHAPFAWSVELPSRGSRPAAGRAARAVLIVESESHGSERLSLPVSVGRALRALSEGEGFPRGRSELLHRVGEISRECARGRMEDLVGRRDYSSWELFDRLRADGYSERVCEEVVARAVEVGIVDDARYGAAFARSKVISGWGRVRIERELSRRGVEPRDVPGWPEEFLSDDEERERALALASRRRLTGKNDYQKIVRFLSSRGFPLGVATSVAREALESSEDGR